MRKLYLITLGVSFSVFNSNASALNFYDNSTSSAPSFVGKYHFVPEQTDSPARHAPSAGDADKSLSNKRTSTPPTIKWVEEKDEPFIQFKESTFPAAGRPSLPDMRRRLDPYSVNEYDGPSSASIMIKP